MPAPASRVRRTLDEAGRILAWEGVALLYGLVVVGALRTWPAASRLARRTAPAGAARTARLLARSSATRPRRAAAIRRSSSLGRNRQRLVRDEVAGGVENVRLGYARCPPTLRDVTVAVVERGEVVAVSPQERAPVAVEVLVVERDELHRARHAGAPPQRAPAPRPCTGCTTRRRRSRRSACREDRPERRCPAGRRPAVSARRPSHPPRSA